MTIIDWAADLIAKGHAAGDIPTYGSPDWHTLPDTDPRRIASCVRAAECWRLDTEPEAIHRRLTEEDLLVRARLRLMSHDLSDATNWADAARRPSWDELQRRRAEVGSG